jgi:hypothetical protein
MARRRPIPKASESQFNEETLLRIAEDMKSGRIPLPRTQLSDDMVTGLRAMIFRNGAITFNVSYFVGESRPFIKIGSLHKGDEDHISLTEARQIAKTIIALGAKGIDVQDGLHRRLLRELKKDGEKWRPGK